MRQIQIENKQKETESKVKKHVGQQYRKKEETKEAMRKSERVAVIKRKRWREL